jgi:hypothetical protein
MRLVWKGTARLLMIAGALVFFFGDKLLSEIRHTSFAAAEFLGIGAGLALLILGAAVELGATRSSSRKN